MSKRAASADSRTHLLKMRRVLRAEAAALLKGLIQYQKGLKARLERILKRLEHDSDAVLLSELAAVRDELAAVRRGAARLAMAEQSTLKLKNEWHDWLRHAHASEGADHEVRQERLEMLASELRLRGIDLPEIVVAAPKQSVRPRPIDAVTAPELEISDEEHRAELLAETDEERPNWDEAGDYWEQLIGGLSPEHADPAQLARLLRAFREIQGQRKRQDRQAGIRRYRLTAFEAWH